MCYDVSQASAYVREKEGVNMDRMTDHIREEVRVAMLRQGVTQAALAERLGLSRQHVSAMLHGRRSNLPEAWEKLLDELGLELIVRRRGT